MDNAWARILFRCWIRHSSSHSSCNGCGCCLRDRDRSMVRTDKACTRDWVKSISSLASVFSFGFVLQKISFSRRLHGHRALIGSRQIISGHGSWPWHGALHGWPHTCRLMTHRCTHFWPGIWHCPAWHERWHVCTPHGSGLPQGWPHSTSFKWQGTYRKETIKRYSKQVFLTLSRLICSPMHNLETRCAHGGHSSSLWQLW